MAWNESDMLSPSSSIFSDNLNSSTSTTNLNGPSLLLFQRMNDLSTKLLISQPTGKQVVALNRRLDELENIITGSFTQDEERALRDDGIDFVSHVVETPKQCTADSDKPHSVLQPAESIRLRKDINGMSQLLLAIGEAIEQLQRRQKENKELHDHALNTIGRVNDQTSQVEAQNVELLNDLMDDEAELKYLKLKLRILEIQALPYVPQDNYDRLAIGIRRWKADWSEVHRRQKRRRRERGLDVQEDSSPFLHEEGKGMIDE